MKTGPKPMDLCGKRFGRLTAIRIHMRDRNKKVLWECECDCGKICYVRVHSLTSGETKSCGCLHRELGIELAMKHFRPPQFGEASPNWRGGITTENNSIRSSSAYKEWRLAIFERDAFTCCSCGQIGQQLHAHHIKSFAKNPDKRLDIDNGVTLCIACHKLVHITNATTEC